MIDTIVASVIVILALAMWTVVAVDLIRGWRR